MSNPTLILTPRQSSDSQALWKAAIDRGWHVHRLASWRVTDEDRAQPNPFLYAEAICGEMIAEQLCIRLVNPADSWLSSLPDEFVGRCIWMLKEDALRKMPGQFFVKLPNNKGLEAGIYEPCGLPSWVDHDTELLVSEVVPFEVEIRCFVLGRKVVTMSGYAMFGLRCGGLEQYYDAAVGFTDRLLADQAVPIPSACVIDVGYIKGHGWAVVEMNAAWSSGIYDCDPASVLDAVRAASAASVVR